MYPYTDNTISKLYFAQNIKIENIPCIVTIKPLSEIKLEFHKYFVKNVTYDNTTEVMLCL